MTETGGMIGTNEVLVENANGIEMATRKTTTAITTA
jgi:hypothetical protein